MERDKFVNQLKDLIRIKSLSGNNAENAKALDLVESWINKDLNHQRIKNVYGKNGEYVEMLLIGNGDLLKPDYGYLVHVDVVSVGEKEELFDPKEKNGSLFGRGASDMKYSIPIGVELLNNLVKSASSPDTTMAITTDEEVGGINCGQYLADKVGFQPRVLIVPDGGDGYVLINRAKGVVHIWTESRGVSAHASRPWEGKNAMDLLVALLNELNKTYAVNSLSENWNTTMNPGFIQSGMSTNQVPDSGVLKLDFRFPETKSAQEIFDEVEKLAKKIDKDMTVEIKALGNPFVVDENHPQVVRFRKTAAEILGKELSTDREYGASDARFWVKFNIPIIMTKPDGGKIHQDGEYINIDSALKFYKILMSYFKKDM